MQRIPYDSMVDVSDVPSCRLGGAPFVKLLLRNLAFGYEDVRARLDNVARFASHFSRSPVSPVDVIVMRRSDKTHTRCALCHLISQEAADSLLAYTPVASSGDRGSTSPPNGPPRFIISRRDCH